jgi:hypothetical protein
MIVSAVHRQRQETIMFGASRVAMGWHQRYGLRR